MKHAVILGASSGIGRALAKVFVQNGYKTVITGRRKELLDSLKAENPSMFISSCFDINNTSQSESALNNILEALGSIDLFVISSGTGNINETLDFSIENNTIQTNVTGFTLAADWCFNVFRKQGYGHLAAITSVAGLRGGRFAPAYGASKAFQINYLEALRQKAMKLKTTMLVTDIRPGFVDTAMAQGDGKFWVAKPETAARQIFIALSRGKSVVYITRRWRIIAWLLKSIPGFLFKRF